MITSSPGFRGGNQRIIEYLLAPGSDRNLLGSIAQCIVPQKFVTDCLLEFDDAVGGGYIWFCPQELLQSPLI